MRRERRGGKAGRSPEGEFVNAHHATSRRPSLLAPRQRCSGRKVMVPVISVLCVGPELHY